MHWVLRVWTDTLVDVLDEETVFEPPLVLEDDDSRVTSPFASVMPIESPTTIFDSPKRPKRFASGSGMHHHEDVRARRHAERLHDRFERMDASMRRLEQQELDLSYEAAMRQFR
jgi:hypothetical protein